MPLSLLEAWATGLPVIASAVGGIPAMIEHGRSGLLFQNGDEDGLVAALSEVLTDPGRARGLSRAGQAHVRKHYSLERMATRYESHYSALLSLTRGRRLERTQSVSEVQIS